MRHPFSLFPSHLSLAHFYWSQLVQIGDIAIDATCGNGHDTLKLCQLALSMDKGKVYAFDIQTQALDSTQSYLKASLSRELIARVELHQQCHSHFPLFIEAGSVKIVVYNLGYLPGGNKAQTTRVETTLQSVKSAQNLLQPGGLISITCYPGHAEGAIEQNILLNYAASLSPQQWNCCHHIWQNRQRAPSLLLMQKACCC